MTKSLHAPQNSSIELSEKSEDKQSAEPPRTVDDSTLKSRSKRESRRQRELEQATFSLELLKVRSGSVSNSEPDSSAQIPPSEPDSSAQISPSKHLPSSPQASTDSQESSEELTQVSTLQMSENNAERERELEQVSKPEPMEENQTSPPSFKPHFYIADDDGSPVRSSPSRSEKKESVLVIISMQKENPVDLEAHYDHEMAAEDHQQEFLLSNDHPDAHSTPEPQPNHGLVTSTSSKTLQLDSREAASMKKDVQKKFVSQSISISMKEKADLAFSPKRSRLTFSK